MRLRQIAPVALVLALTAVGFIVARVITERDARRDSEHRAEVAAAQIRGRIAQAASLTESLRRFMLDASGTGVTSDQFASNALRWLSPARFPAAAWVERVPGSQRAAYERRSGQPIVTHDERHSVVPPGSRSSYLPATLVSGFPPMAVPGSDLSGVPGMATALTGATRLDRVAATPVAPPRTGTHGLFLVAPAPNLIGDVLRPGYAAVFVPDRTLRAAAEDAPTVEIMAGGGSTEARESDRTASATFTTAGRPFEVVVAQESVQGAAAVLPWIIVAAGLVLAALAAALGVSAARRARAQDELDRIFTLSSDLIAVADFDGHFTRVNPAVEDVLGYTQEEFVGRPYLDLVHPDDREGTAAEAAAIGEGKKALSFENRYVRKDGSHRILEWTSTPVVEDRVMYGMARDVTDRRRVEAEAKRLADEQAALRRVATLVAQGLGPEAVFRAVAEEAEALFGSDISAIVRFEADGTIRVMGDHGGPYTSGARVEPEPDYVVASVRETGQASRFDTDDPAAAGMPEFVRAEGIRSGIASPIIVDGELWGAITVASFDSPLPSGAERRLADFTDLVATAVSNTQARGAVQRLADEQAALRRVATFVAVGVPAKELFEVVVREAGALLGADFAGVARFEDDAVVTVGVWSAEGEHPAVPPRWRMQPGDPATTIAETGEAMRWNDWTDIPGPIAEFIRELGVRSSVGTPIVVAGRLWGAMAIHSKHESAFPPDTEARMAQFTDLAAAAIANAEARAQVGQLAEEQAALRRVATLVAGEAPQAEIFGAIAAEIGPLFGLEETRLVRYVDDRSGVVVARSGSSDQFPVGYRISTDGETISSRVLRTGEPVRIDEYPTVDTPMAETVRSMGIRAALATPITVEGRLWGAITAGATQDDPLPPDTEERLGQFTDLMATAIANAEARAEVERLADEQAALRRLATVVARRGSRDQVFTAMAEEVQRLFGTQLIEMFRYEGGTGVIAVASAGVGKDVFPVGARFELGGNNGPTRVVETAEVVRIDDYSEATGRIAEAVGSTGVRSVVATPLLVEDGLWGVMVIGSTEDEPLAPGTEFRLGQFTELMATAIADTESRARVEQLADEQAALRRVATLVAEGAPPAAVFEAVAAETERLLGADRVSLSRYETDAEITVLAHRGSGAELVPTGSRLSHEGDNVQEMVRRTERPARMENFDEAQGQIAEVQRTMGVRGVVAVPVVVNRRVWGVIGASWVGEQSPAVDTEERMAQFAGLLETAIANADAGDQLTASRARLVTEGDAARRRLVRDLHDGAQQRLVHTIVSLKLAQRAFGKEDDKTESLLGEALEHAEESNRELRELAHGILPAVLTRGGLQAGVDAVVSRLDLPVEVDLPSERLPPEIEASAYFIVAEALTNVVKHAHAEHAEVSAAVEDGVLHVQVRDDGFGGANPDGHGLVGIADRVTALGGRLEIDSPYGDGTLLAATLPLHAG